jgi:hypothetical protein
MGNRTIRNEPFVHPIARYSEFAVILVARHGCFIDRALECKPSSFCFGEQETDATADPVLALISITFVPTAEKILFPSADQATVLPDASVWIEPSEPDSEYLEYAFTIQDSTKIGNRVKTNGDALKLLKRCANWHSAGTI